MDERKNGISVTTDWNACCRIGNRRWIVDSLQSEYVASHAVSALPNVPKMPVQLGSEYGITGQSEICSFGNQRAWLCTSKSGLLT